MSEFITILIAASPVLELRGSIPIAIGVFGFTAQKAFLLSLLGNAIPAFFLLLFLPLFANYIAKKVVPIEKSLNWVFERTKSKHSKKVEAMGLIALFLLTAAPLPLTGVWTASILAFLFKFPFNKALPTILLGMIVAGFLVTALVTGLIYII
ncbi:MAG: small multi-drug export protein [bacterium]|nr:small multi-drug export protein [bacterium]